MTILLLLTHNVLVFFLYRDIVRMGAVTQVYIDKLLGDKFSKVALVGMYKKQVLIYQHEMSLMK